MQGLQSAHCTLVHGGSCDVESGITESRGNRGFRVRCGLSGVVKNTVRVPEFPQGKGGIPFIFEVGGKDCQSSGLAEGMNFQCSNSLIPLSGVIRRRLRRGRGSGNEISVT